jgi:hypothetical protein
MYSSVEEMVRRHLEAAKKVRRENRDPAKARAFLERAGILKPSKSTPNGTRRDKRAS